MSRLGAVARLVLCDIKAEARRTAIVLGVSALLFCLLITLFFFRTLTVGQDIPFPPSLGLLLEGPTFLGDYSGFENLSMLASIKGQLGADEIRGWIERVGLDPADKRHYRKYSLGMKQRLGIAAALMETPDIVMLDEPTNALDSGGVEMVRREVEEARGRGATVILACHDANVLQGLSDEIWHLAEGHIDGHEVLAKGVYDER